MANWRLPFQSTLCILFVHSTIWTTKMMDFPFEILIFSSVLIGTAAICAIEIEFWMDQPFTFRIFAWTSLTGKKRVCECVRILVELTAIDRQTITNSYTCNILWKTRRKGSHSIEHGISYIVYYYKADRNEQRRASNAFSPILLPPSIPPRTHTRTQASCSISLDSVTIFHSYLTSVPFFLATSFQYLIDCLVVFVCAQLFSRQASSMFTFRAAISALLLLFDPIIWLCDVCVRSENGSVSASCLPFATRLCRMAREKKLTLCIHIISIWVLCGFMFSTQRW